MDLRTAVGIVAGLIDGITGLPAPGYTPIHPDNLIKHGVNFPWTCISWTDEDPGYYESNSRWSESHRPRTDIEVHLIITAKTSTHFALELIDWAKKIEDAIKTYTVAEGALFNLCVTKNQAAYDEAGKWAWLVSTLTLGAYKD